MQTPSRYLITVLAAACLFVFTTISSFAVATLTQEIDPTEVNVGDPAIITLTVQGGSILGAQLPTVDGLQIGGTNLQIKSVEDNNGYTTSVALNISVTSTRSGNFIIPAFDIHTQEGDVLHVKAMRLHVLGNGNPPATPAPSIPAPAPAPTPDATAVASTNAAPAGPVVMPPSAVAPPAAPDNTAATTATNPNVPRDPDGGPAKVFIVISPQTTDAYVGQAIPMWIQFFIRMEVNSDQNSLPTIKGSDFLINSFTTRGQGSVGMLENIQYGRESWMTAISAPKSGDFPLSMERDSYWIKSITTDNVNSFFGMFSRHANLAHEMISSNQLIMHIHALPTEGQPPHFTGAIGQLKVTGEAMPASVEVGEPVILHFTVSGDGNFDYVRCPSLPEDPAWKAYAPKSNINYLNESRTTAVKNFEQSIIPQKNGTLQLPAATFSYFDPNTKQYVIVPIALPAITVTGSPLPIATAAPDADDSTSVAVLPPAVGLLPNRLEAGFPQMNLTPAFRQPWFWAVQSGFVFLPMLGALFLFFHLRATPDTGLAERQQRQRSLQQEEAAMSEAVQRNDAVAFFLAARHALQLQLGAHWKLKPEAITLGEVRSRDPQLAETLAPVFRQADEVIYSGQASPNLDLAEWEKRVRAELLQPQPA